ncbi:putative ribonuclease H-like domain-containing protein [Tanacetum coccineum]
MGHFVRECKAPRNKEGQFRNQDNIRKHGNNEDISSRVMLAIDGVGFYWSDMAEEQVQTNMALMAFSDSEVYNDKTCSKTCLKNYETLKKQCDDLIVKLNQTEFTAATYKRGLATVEEQLITYRKNEVLFSEEVAVLKREVACKDYEINVLKSEFEKVKQEKEGIEFKIEKFDKASKDLDKLLGSQITDKSKKGLGYNVVPPPHPLIYNRPKKLDLSYSGLDEFKEPEFKSYGSEDSKPQQDDTGFVDSGCSRYMTGNIAYLSDFKEFDRCYVTFGGGAHGGRIFGKGTLKTDSLDFEDILLKIPRKDNMYSFDMMNIVPKESLTCLVAKATSDESMLWHKRLGHINFKNINNVVMDKLVRGLPTKRFENDQTCVVCLKGKQHRASYKSKFLNPITKPLFILHMDLFGPTFDETSEILKNFIKEIENLVDKKVKIIRSDNGTEFKNKAEAVSTACYVQNKVLIVKPHNKTPYELFRGFKPALSFMRPFGCHVTILNSLDSLSKFDGKSDEENKPMIKGNGLKWLFDIDSLTQSMNYVPVTAGTISNESVDASYFDSPTKDVVNGEPKTVDDAQKQVEDDPDNENDDQDKFEDDSSTKDVNAARQYINTASPKVNIVGPLVNTASSNQDSPKDMFTMGASHTLEATHVEFFSDKDEPEVDLENITNSYTVPTTPNTRIHKDHPIDNVIGDIEPTSIAKALSDSSWVETQEELLQFKLQQVWILIDLPSGKKAIGTKWVFKNKKDKKGIVIRNKARLVTQGHRQEEGIDYEEVFAPVARIEVIRLFLAYASFMGFLVYQMDAKSAFSYGTIEKEVYVTQPPGFKDPDHPNKVYKVYVDNIIFGPTNKELCTRFEKLMKDKFQMSSMEELTFFLGLQVQQKEDGIFISQDKYVAEISKKFNYTNMKSASTPVDLEKPLVKYGDANDVDVHIYRSMIGSLIYLKGKPTLGLWYSRDSPFELVAYTDSDYAGATQDRKSTTGGCQFLGNRLISWQCKKQTVVVTSTTEAEYVAATSCCRQVLWIQNQLLDYGYNFTNTVINIDNNSTICIIENVVQHSKTKHIEIRHHFIRDCNAKKLIQMVKMHTDYNVADFLTKGFDAGRFQYLVSSIGMLNP